MALLFSHFFLQVPTEGVTSNHLDLPEERQVDATECALNSDLERGTVDLPESTANISTKIPDLPSQLKPEINMSRRSKRKSKSPCGSKYVVCNGADNLQVHPPFINASMPQIEFNCSLNSGLLSG